MEKIATGLRPLFETADINPTGSIVVRTSIENKEKENMPLIKGGFLIGKKARSENCCCYKMMYNIYPGYIIYIKLN